MRYLDNADIICIDGEIAVYVDTLPAAVNGLCYQL